jgi:hypothetical protein
VEDVIGDIHECIREALRWLLMDYDVSAMASTLLLFALLPGPKCL